MNVVPSRATNVATAPLAPADHTSRAGKILRAGHELLSLLERGQPIGAANLRTVLINLFGGSDAEGFWTWKDAYEASEVAQVLFLRKFSASITAHSKATLAMLTKVAGLIPTHTRRSEESQQLQQVSTPIPLAYVAACAACIMADDTVLDPSAGIDLMAIFAELAHARLSLNEYAPVRHGLLEQLFSGSTVSQHDAAHIDDYLDRSIRPTVILMNPPFSAAVHVEGRMVAAAWRHFASAFARLAPGGWLVAITGLSLTAEEGGLKDELPPIHTFLNRILALTIAMQNLLFDAFEQLLAARIEGAIAAGVYDKGLETLTADRMTVKNRRLVYTHPVTGAQSHLLTFERMDSNQPMQLADALSLAARDPRAMLMVNGKSGRPAVQVPTRSIMLDDGSVQPRVALVRPMDEIRFEVRQLEETNWEEADEQKFSTAWNTEGVDLPEFSLSTMHVVSGLLLPIWKLLPQDYCRVYRLETDEGERIVGRLISSEGLSRLCRNFGLDQTGVVTAAQVWQSLLGGSAVVARAGSMTLRRVRVMNDYRIELAGFTDGMRDGLRSIGLFSEMIAWKVRFFIPASDDGQAVLSRLIERHRVVDVAGRS